MVAGADIVAYARTQLGDPYVWGAEGPNAFDCSGLVEYVYRHFGLVTPRTTSQMMGSGSNLQPVTRADIQAGDLLFSNWTGAAHSHVGIYDGNGHIIEAPEPGKNVMVTNLGSSYWSHIDAIRRVPGIAGARAGSGGGTDTAGAIRTGLGAVPGVGPALAAIIGLVPNPANLTDAVSNVGAALVGIAESAVGVAALANTVTRAFLPSNLIRGVAFFFGTIFVLIGVWFLAREVKESSS